MTQPSSLRAFLTPLMTAPVVPMPPNESWGQLVDRMHQVVLIVSAVASSWLGMQAVHEFGHVLAAWCTGGRVARFEARFGKGKVQGTAGKAGKK